MDGIHDICVVVPAYNALPYCKDMVDSIVSQDFGPYDVQVLVIDDGSTDATGEYFDEVHQKYPYFEVIHQSNSGSPAQPRNLGIERSSSEYVFFADADDSFVGNSIRRMLDHAYQKKLDIAVVKLDASDWNISYGGMFEASQDNCTVTNSPILNSLGPCKLFKRSILVEHGIRFATDIAYEDLPFSLEAYLNASNISILADCDYYKYVKRDDGNSLSQGSQNADSVFNKTRGRVDGLLYLLDVCERYHSQVECPMIYVRAYRYADRLYGQKALREDDDMYGRLHDALSKQYADELRALLPFSLLTVTDAFVHLSKREFFEFFDSAVTTRAVAYSDGGVMKYALIGSDGNEILARSWPEHPGEKLLKSKYKKSCVTSTRTTDEAIAIGGFAEALVQSDGEPSAIALCCEAYKRDARIRLGGVELADCKAERVYPGVWFVSYVWSCIIHLQELDELLADIDKPVRIDFSLSACLGERYVEWRLGKSHANAALDDYAGSRIQNDLYYGKCLLTGFGNMSLLVTDRVALDAQRKPLVLGKLGVDGSRFELAGNILIANASTCGMQLAMRRIEGGEILDGPEAILGDESGESFIHPFTCQFDVAHALRNQGDSKWELGYRLIGEGAVGPFQTFSCSSKQGELYQSSIVRESDTCIVPLVDRKKMQLHVERFQEGVIHLFDCRIKRLIWKSDVVVELAGEVCVPDEAHPDLTVVLRSVGAEGAFLEVAFDTVQKIADEAIGSATVDGVERPFPIKWAWSCDIDTTKLLERRFRIAEALGLSRHTKRTWTFVMKAKGPCGEGEMEFGRQRPTGTLGAFQKGSYENKHASVLAHKDSKDRIVFTVES